MATKTRRKSFEVYSLLGGTLPESKLNRFVKGEVQAHLTGLLVAAVKRLEGQGYNALDNLGDRKLDSLLGDTLVQSELCKVLRERFVDWDRVCQELVF